MSPWMMERVLKMLAVKRTPHDDVTVDGDSVYMRFDGISLTPTATGWRVGFSLGRIELFYVDVAASPTDGVEVARLDGVLRFDITT